jgi:hypothetical protein
MPEAFANAVPTLQQMEIETEWALGCNCDEVESEDQTNLTAGTVTPTFPTGSTAVRAIVIASIHALNVAANTHHISHIVQGRVSGGAWQDLLDLSATAQLGLVNLDGATDAWVAAVDCTALVNTSGLAYEFRFVIDSDNAGAVRYITCFTLVLVYHM